MREIKGFMKDVVRELVRVAAKCYNTRMALNTSAIFLCLDLFVQTVEHLR